MTEDPYRTPGSELGNARRKPVYSIGGILAATVLGSLAAGIFLIFSNYMSLGNTRLAKLTLVWGLAGYALIIASASVLPNSPTLGALFIVLQTGLAGILADRLQGRAIEYHREHGGLMHSPLRAAGIGVLTGMVVLFVLVVLLLMWTILVGTAP